jgi:limonene-1,2-epoxide hydrolase
MSARLAVVLNLIEAWKAGDLEAVLSHLHEDVVWHFAAGAAPPARGKVKARRFMAGFRPQLDQIRWRILDHAERGNRLFVEGVEDYTQTDGKVVVAPYAGVFDFEGDLIIGWRDYVDVGTMDAQREGRPTPAWVMDLAAQTQAPA